jgi:hypothetical protein
VLSAGSVLLAWGGVFGRAENPMPIPAAATTTAAMTIAMSFRKQFFRNISGIYPYHHESNVGAFIHLVLKLLPNSSLLEKALVPPRLSLLLLLFACPDSWAYATYVVGNFAANVITEVAATKKAIEIVKN